MKLTSEELRNLYQAQTARSERTQLECQGAETMIKAATGELSEDERGRFADHLASCFDCSQEYRLVLNSVPVTAKAESDNVVRLIPRPSRLTWPAKAIAALVAIAVGTSLVVWLYQQQVEPSIEVTRGGATIALEVQPQNHALVDEIPKELKWSRYETASSYQISLFDFESTLMWESQASTENYIAIPEDVRLRMKRGQPFYWRVTARRGVEHYRSELFQFVVRGD